MMQVKITSFLIVTITLFLTFFAETTHASVFDPNLQFKTSSTEHFDIHYPDTLSEAADRLSGIAETVHTTLSPKLDWKPWGKTQVVLVDTSDSANGRASIFPYNALLLYVAPPRGESALLHYDDYLTMLFTHEYTHILHLDAYDGIVTPFRAIFGKILSPNGATPGWIREGWATYSESLETGYGRGNSSYTKMVIRTDLLDNKFLPIDGADGVQTPWPSASGQYLYGTAFWDWLADTYGRDRVMAFHKRNRESMALAQVSARAFKVFGKGFKKLWEDWEAALRRDLDTLKTHVGQTTSSTPLTRDHQASYLTWNHAGTTRAFRITSVDDGAHIYTSDANHPEQKKSISKKNIEGSGQLSFSPDDRSLAYSAFQRSHYAYASRLFIHTFETHQTKQLMDDHKKPLRGFDPEFTRDGQALIYVCRDESENDPRGYDSICRYDLASKTVSTLLRGKSGEQFLNPRVAKTRDVIAVVSYANGRSRLLTLPISEKATPTVLIDSGAHVLYPTWHPTEADTLALSSDMTGIYNLYTIDTRTKKLAQVTNTLTGVFQPAHDPSGTLYAQVYTEAGFELHKIDPLTSNSVISGTTDREAQTFGERCKTLCMTTDEGGMSSVNPASINPPYPPFSKGERTPDATEKSSNSSRFDLSSTTGEEKQLVASREYTPFTKSLFLPRYAMPLLVITDDDAIIGLSTGSHDPLYRHLWGAGVNYRTGPGFLGFNTGYTYNRYTPYAYTNVFRYSVNFGDVFGIGDDFYEERWRGAIGLGTTVKQHSFNANYFFEDRSAFNQTDQAISLLNLGHYAGIHASYGFNYDLKQYPASISTEKGLSLRLDVDVSNQLLGADDKNEQSVWTGDLRYYYELPWADHHVLALRGTGGITFGDDFVQRTFALGGSLGESVLSQASRRTFSLRGVPFADFSGERAMVFSAEYRLPLIPIERGPGTAPFFLKRLHLAFFGDYGDIFNKNVRDRDNRSFFAPFMLGVGSELRADFVVGHGLPLTGRLGYGIIVVNNDRVSGLTDDTHGGDAKYGTMILEIGTSF